MADSKISGLTALTGANLASGDLFGAVDISDTTMDASGTNKKMTATELSTGLSAIEGAALTLVTPLVIPAPRVDGVASAPGTRVARVVRAVCRRAGTLKAFTFFVGASSGNVIGWVSDVGEASSGNYSKLWDSGSVAVGTANTFQTSLGDPNITVTAGQELMLWIMFDNGTASYGRGPNPLTTSSTTSALPAALRPVPSGMTDALMSGAVTVGSFAAPSTVADSGVTRSPAPPLIMARIA